MYRRIVVLFISFLCLIICISIPCFSEDTEKNLSKYLALLGLETSGNSFSVDQDFLDNINNVVVMGISGTVSHGYSGESNTQIRSMDWISNREVERNEFISFVNSLSTDYFKQTCGIASYENTSDETYYWKDYDRHSDVYCWLDESSKIHLMWNYRDNLTDDSLKDSPANEEKISIASANDDTEKKTVQADITDGEDYLLKLKLIRLMIVNGATEAENCINMIHNVWYNAIYEKHDNRTDEFVFDNDTGKPRSFDDALDYLFSDQEFASQLLDILDQSSNVQEKMKGIINYPDKCKNAFDAMEELYEDYMTLVRMATDPTGSLNKYTDDYNNNTAEFLSDHDRLSLYID